MIALTLVTMVAEIVAGAWSGSMALTADGWHMATHADAMAITVFAYHFAQRHARNPRFSFGTGKVGDLAAFANAVLLAGISVLIAAESIERLVDPRPIAFGDAIWVAVIGLVVNLVCAWLLRGSHDHHHGHDHGHGHDHDHGRLPMETTAPAVPDVNLRAAYIHVLSDAATSVAAIIALSGGRMFGWVWLDPVMGLVGSVVILRWAWGLARQTSAVLLDTVPDERLSHAIRDIVESGGDRVVDFHLWQIGPGHHAAILSVVVAGGEPRYREEIEQLPGLSHLTLDVRHEQRPEMTS